MLLCLIGLHHPETAVSAMVQENQNLAALADEIKVSEVNMPESIEKQAGTAPENKALTAASDAAAFRRAAFFEDDQAAAATDAADAQADLPLAAVRQRPPAPARWPQDAAQHLRGQRVLVLGLGASGLAMARWCVLAPGRR